MNVVCSARRGGVSIIDAPDAARAPEDGGDWVSEAPLSRGAATVSRADVDGRRARARIETSRPCGRRWNQPVSSLRLVVCALASCGRAFLLCSQCDRGNRYCSRECARTARAAALIATRRNYEASEQARADRRARARRYRLAKKESVTDQGSPAPNRHRKLPESRLAAPPLGAEREQPKVRNYASKNGDVRECDLSGARCVCCGSVSNYVRLGFL